MTYEMLLNILQHSIPSIFGVLFLVSLISYGNKKLILFNAGLFTLYAILVSYLLIPVIGISNYEKSVFFIIVVGHISVLFFISVNFYNNLYYYFAMSNAVLAISVLCNAIWCLFQYSNLVNVFVLFVVSIVIYLFALRHCLTPLRFISDYVKAVRGASMFIPILTMIAVLSVIAFSSIHFTKQPLFDLLIVLEVEASFFLYLYVLYYNLKTVRSLDDEKLKAELLKSELATYNKYVSWSLQNNHDLRHHNAVLAEYLENGEVDLAKEYLNEYTKTVSLFELKQYCKNPIANAVFRLYQQRSEDAGIDLRVTADIPEQLPMRAPDLGVLLSNLLENACEACEKSFPPTFIVVAVDQDGDSLRIQLRNSVGEQTEFVEGLPLSTKKHGGVGLKSVSRIVDQNGGMLRLFQKAGEFHTQIILPLK